MMDNEFEEHELIAINAYKKLQKETYEKIKDITPEKLNMTFYWSGIALLELSTVCFIKSIAAFGSCWKSKKERNIEAAKIKLFDDPLLPPEKLSDIALKIIDILERHETEVFKILVGYSESYQPPNTKSIQFSVDERWHESGLQMIRKAFRFIILAIQE